MNKQPFNIILFLIGLIGTAAYFTPEYRVELLGFTTFLGIIGIILEA